MKKCYKIKNLFGSYIYNTITAEEKAEVDRHIQTCEKCALDLKTQQKAISIIKNNANIDENSIYYDQDRFVFNVYRKIALESIERKSRQVFIRKFIFQPAIATALIALLIVIGITRFRTNIPESEIPSFTASISTKLPEIADTKGSVINLPAKKLEKKEIYKPKSVVIISKSASPEKQILTTNQNKPDILLTEAKISNSNNWLMNADLLNYSLNEPRRALSRYQMIIDYYPDTDAAKEAQKRIKTILDSEYKYQDEKANSDEGTNTDI